MSFFTDAIGISDAEIIAISTILMIMNVWDAINTH
jgi:Na+/melibiose symporter-like transporter